MRDNKLFPVWISNSSINDFLKCSRAYYLRHVYKDEFTGHRITLINPYLALGQAVHEVLDSIATIPVDKRFEIPLKDIFEKVSEKYRGYTGLFKDVEEKEFKMRGLNMLERVMQNPGPLKNKAIRLKVDPKFPLPNFSLSIEHNIILCGRVDWLEYLENENAVRIIDFKTGKHEEESGSFQVPIYLLLAQNLQTRKVKSFAYWYLDKDNSPKDIDLPDLQPAKEEILRLGIRIRQLRKDNFYKCKSGGCRECESLEKILAGEANLVDSTGNQDRYVLKN